MLGILFVGQTILSAKSLASKVIPENKEETILQEETFKEEQAVQKGPKTWVVVIVLAVIIVLIIFMALGLRSASSAINEGDPAKFFQLEDINKEMFDLADYKGEVIVLNFFATWCEPCVAEADELEQFHQKVEETQKAKFFIVDVGELQETVQTFIDRHDSNAVYLFDKRLEIMKDYGVTGQPETIIIDKNGIVQKRIIGETTARNLEILVDQYQ